MSTERDELVDLLAEADSPGKYLRNARQFIYGPTADTILKTFTRKPRTVTTAAELDALPVGSIIDAVNGGPAQIRRYYGPARQSRYIEYIYSDDDHAYSIEEFAGFMDSATVLHEPTA